MNRRLIIISNDGGHEDFLPGVQHDRFGYLRFFRSCYGGAWGTNEILCPEINGMTRNDLLSYIDDVEREGHVDYWLIVFCGHGGADENGMTYFQLSPNDNTILVNEIEQKVANSRLLLIADSCRSLSMFESGGRIPNNVPFPDAMDTPYRIRCRLMYNEKIASTPFNQHTIGYAARLGQYASELDNGCGGQYSQALLECAKKQINTTIRHRDEPESMFNGVFASFSYVHSCAQNLVNIRTKGRQLPQIEMPRTRQLPFWVVPKRNRLLGEDDYKIKKV